MYLHAKSYDPAANGTRKKITSGLRKLVGDRDNWVCHRCALPISVERKVPHPLAPVADHYPITQLKGGLAIPSNLRIAHNICNNPAGVPTLVPRYDLGSRRIIEHEFNEVERERVLTIKAKWEANGYKQLSGSRILWDETRWEEIPEEWDYAYNDSECAYHSEFDEAWREMVISGDITRG
jgi:hypothetical protein